MAILGKNIFILLSSGTAIAAGIKTCRLSAGCNTIDVASTTSAQAREFIAGRTEWSMSCSWLLVAESDVRTNILKVGQTYTLRFGTADSYVSGAVICTRCDVDANIQNLANGSFEFKGTGELS